MGNGEQADRSRLRLALRAGNRVLVLGAAHSIKDTIVNQLMLGALRRVMGRAE